MPKIKKAKKKLRYSGDPRLKFQPKIIWKLVRCFDFPFPQIWYHIRCKILPLVNGGTGGCFRWIVAYNWCSIRFCLFSIVQDLGISPYPTGVWDGCSEKTKILQFLFDRKRGNTYSIFSWSLWCTLFFQKRKKRTIFLKLST